jgi:hypothetical protein
MKVFLTIAGLMIGLFIHAQSAPTASTPAPASAPAKLRYVPQPGAHLNYRMTIRDETYWKKSGKTHDHEQAQIEYKLTGESPSAGCFSNWSVRMHRIESVATEKKDSEADPDTLFHMMERVAFRASLDAYRFSFCISKSGRYSDIQSQRMVPELPPDADEKTVVRWMFEGNYEGFILANYLLPMINSLFPQFPDQPLSVGDSWHDIDRIHSEGPIGAYVEQRMLTLQGKTAETFSLGYTSKINPLNKDVKAGGMQMTVNGEGAGKFTFDATSNQVVRGEFTLTRHQKDQVPPELTQALKEVQTGDYDVISRITIERR